MKEVLMFVVFLYLLSSCRDDRIEKNYELDYNPNHEINIVIADNGYQLIKIPGHILFYGHNKDFIIANQKPVDSIINNRENLEYDKMINKVFKTTFNQFWIITLNNDSIYGPLNKKDYLLKRNQLGIPKNLKLDNSTLEYYKNGQRSDVEYTMLDSETINVDKLKGNLTE
jgi:hypothetical protein